MLTIDTSNSSAVEFLSYDPESRRISYIWRKSPDVVYHIPHQSLEQFQALEYKRSLGAAINAIC
jgi:hypothetical protein